MMRASPKSDRSIEILATIQKYSQADITRAITAALDDGMIYRRGWLEQIQKATKAALKRTKQEVKL